MPKVGDALDRPGHWYARGRLRSTDAPEGHVEAFSSPHTGYVWPSLSAGDRVTGVGWSRSRRRRFPLAVFVSAAMVGAGAFIVLTGGGEKVRSMPGPVADFQKLAVALGFGLDQVGVSGNRFTSADSIFAQLDLESTKTLFSFDPVEAARRIEALPWVARAEITRVVPGGLAIKIRERKAFALWEAAGELHLIDETGRVLGRTDRRAAPNLPLVKGDGAAEQASALMTLLASYPVISTRFKHAERVAGRRWRVELVNGSRLELPGDRAAAALALIDGKPFLRRLIEKDHQRIDMRAPGRIAVEQLAPQQAGMERARTIEDLVRGGG